MGYFSVLIVLIPESFPFLFLLSLPFLSFIFYTDSEITRNKGKVEGENQDKRRRREEKEEKVKLGS